MSDNLLIATSRSPFEWLEIDQELCANDYGNSPCFAAVGVTGGQKCLNTRASCQYPDAYDGSDTLTLRFCRNQGVIPDDYTYLPYLDDVRVSPAKINLGGGDQGKSSLGIRGGLSASLGDYPYTDKLTDPYVSERTYDPYEQGTFWTKWHARNPNYFNWEIRHKSGLIDPDTRQVDPTTLITRTFFMSGFSMNNIKSGVSIQAQDVFTKAMNDKAKCPTVNTGKLVASINDIVTTATLTPAGIGDAEYPASGFLTIDSEYMSFTRSSDTLTIVRGLRNTTAVEHDEGAVVQVAKVITAQSPADICEDLLVNFAGIDSSYLDTVQWASEQTDYLPRLYSTVITKPTGVMQLLGEMCEQMYFTLFWNEREALMKLRAVRPAIDDTITELTDERNILVDSIGWSDLTDQFISQVWVHYGQVDPTKKLDETSNYASLSVTVAADAETFYGQAKVREIYSRWMTISDASAADDLGDSILARYSSVNKACSFQLDAKDRDLWLADFVTVQNRNVVDMYGAQIPASMQITSVSEDKAGTTYSYSAVEYAGKIDARPDEILIRIPSDAVNINLRELFDFKYGVTPVSGDKIRFIIDPNVTIGGACEYQDTGFPDLKVAVPTYSGIYAYIGTSFAYASESRTFNYIPRQGLYTPSVDYTHATTLAGGDVYNDPTTGTPTADKAFSDIREREVLPAIDTGTWPAGVILYLDVSGGAKIIGQGGNGGQTLLKTPSSIALGNGGDGGHALKIQHAITINNQGLIAGGGGGGGSSLRGLPSGSQALFILAGGGGGAGFINTNAGTNKISGVSGTSLNRTPSSGSLLDYGISGHIKYYVSSTLYQALGGNGGGLATAGTDGTLYTGAGNKKSSGGLAGKAISTGASLVTWTNKGDVRGSEVV